MARPSQAPERAKSADECLLAAVRAPSPEEKLRLAREGLGCESIRRDTRLLLERQLYVARLEQRRFRQALAHAEAMIALGTLRDVAYHDAARVHAALGELDRAIVRQRFAARVAHAERRSFHRWALATFQHFAGQPADALATLGRAMRCSTRDRPLLKAHALYVRLDAGLPVRNEAAVIEGLSASPSREGYGRFLLGMISYHRGQSDVARAELGAFVARHADADPARAITLREELRRARVALGRLHAS